MTIDAGEEERLRESLVQLEQLLESESRMAVPMLDNLAAHEQLRRTAETRADLLERTNDTLLEQLETIRARQEEIQRLTAPVLTMWRNVLVVPIVGPLVLALDPSASRACPHRRALRTGRRDPRRQGRSLRV